MHWIECSLIFLIIEFINFELYELLFIYLFINIFFG